MSPRPHPLDPAHLRRRLALVTQRGWRTATGGLAEPCLFLHLPKCGGTSLAAALAGTVSARHRVGTIDALATRRAAAMLTTGRADLSTCHEDFDQGHRTFALREQMLAALMAQGCRLIHGHVLFPARLLTAAPYRLVTMMRAPRARTLSNYAMAVRAGVIPDDVDRWLEGPVGRRMAQQALRYLAAEHDVADERAALSRAQAALARFDLVGILEDVPGFQTRFAARFGVRPVMARLNRGTGGIALTAAQGARLDRLLEPDMVLYDQARELSRAPAVLTPPPLASGAAGGAAV